jgi:hypothetical protein
MQLDLCCILVTLAHSNEFILFLIYSSSDHIYPLTHNHYQHGPEENSSNSAIEYTASHHSFSLHVDYECTTLVTFVALQLLMARNHQRSRALRNLLASWQLSQPLFCWVLLWNTQPDDRPAVPSAVRLTTWWSVTFKTDSFSRHVCGEDTRIFTYCPKARKVPLGSAVPSILTLLVLYTAGHWVTTSWYSSRFWTAYSCRGKQYSKKSNKTHWNIENVNNMH